MSDLMVLSFIPDKPAKGGDKSGMTTHMGVVDIHGNTDALIFNGRWRNRYAETALPNANAGANRTIAIGVYNWVNPYGGYNAAVTNFIGQQHENIFSISLWNWTTGTYVQHFQDAVKRTAWFVNNSATVSAVTGTALTTADIGKLVAVWATDGSSYSLVASGYRIASVLSGTSFTMDAPWYLPTQASTSMWLSTPVTATGSGFTAKITPGSFITVRNRCFVAWQNSILPTNTSKILDYRVSAVVPTIQVQAYPIGVPAPVNNITYSIPSPSYYGFVGVSGEAYKNRMGVVSPIGANPSSIPPNLTIVVNGSEYIATSYKNWSASSTSNNVTITSPRTFSYLPAGDALIYFAVGTNFYSAGPTFVATVATITEYQADTGLIIGTLDRDISAGTKTWSTAGLTYLLASDYEGATALSVPFTAMPVTAMVWTSQGPTYAIARYNPVTGHVSNIGPKLRVAEQNQAVSTINLQIPVDGVGSDWYMAGYTKVILFRTQLSAGGGALFPLGNFTDNGVGLLDNYPTSIFTSGTRLFSDIYQDTTLLSSFVGPEVTNSPPRLGFVYMAFWDDVIWGVYPDDPSGIVYSGPVGGGGVVPFGVAQECFPSLNLLRVSSDDGAVLGLHVVGPVLVVTTQRYAYYIGGAAGSYRLIKLSSSMIGVMGNMMCEWTGDAGEGTDRVAYLSPDGKIMRFTQGYGTEEISKPIGSAIVGEFSNLYTMRIFQMAASGYQLLLCRLGTNLWALDYANGTWHKLTTNVGLPDAFACQYPFGAAVNQYFAKGGTLYQWFSESGASYRPGQLTTFPIDLGDIYRHKQIFGVRIWVSSAAILAPLDISGYIISDEGVQIAGEQRRWNLTFQEEPDKVRSPQNAGSSGYKLDASNATAIVGYVTPASTTYPGSPSTGHRFYLYLTWGASGRYDIYAIHPLFRPPEPDGA